MDKYTEDDKLQAEVKKLHAEERNLSRPYLAQPTSWVALGALLISLAGNYLQHSDVVVSEKLAKIEEKEHQIKRDQLAEQERTLLASIAAKQKFFDEQSALISTQQSKLEAIQIEISKPKLTSAALSAAIANASSTVAQTEKINAETVQNLSKSLTISRDFGAAHAFEAKGYEALINGKFEDALSAFSASEASATSYHFANEIVRLLRQQRDNLQNPNTQREVLRTVALKYSAYAAPNQRQRLEQLAK